MSARTDKSQKRQTLADRHDAPEGMYSNPVNKFAEIYGSAKVGQARMFVCALASALVAMVAVAGVVTMASRSTAVPFYVAVNDEGGVRNVPTKIENLRPNQAVIKAELGKFTVNIFTIDPVLTPKYFKTANVMTSGLATSQFAEFRAEQNISERLANEPDMTRVANVTSVDISTPGVAFVFLGTNESRGSVNKAVLAKWRVTLKYELQPPKNEEEILANPLGLFVTSLSITQEGK